MLHGTHELGRRDFMASPELGSSGRFCNIVTRLIGTQHGKRSLYSTLCAFAIDAWVGSPNQSEN
jgi:hypothetical protein